MGVSGRGRGRRLVSPLVGVALLTTLLSVVPVTSVRAADFGYQDQSYSGTSAPTGQKPQSKLWFNDGIWWASMYNPSRKAFDIHRLDWATQRWSDTTVRIDERSKSQADALWDGSRLYVVSAISDQSNSSRPPTSGDLSIRVMRYSYSPATKTYSLDAGFPVTVANAAVEAAVMDEDSTGMLWITWTYTNGSGGRNVVITHSTTDTAHFVAPYVLPLAGANGLDNDDISALVSYNGRIGVMWSNQNDSTVHFAYHVDGTVDSAWIADNALSGPGYADDHLNIKSLQADSSGQVFAAVKTSLNSDTCPTTSQKPLLLLLIMDGTGGWQRRTYSVGSDCTTRPIVLVDPEHRQIYMFATVPAPGSSYGSGGSIYYKQTDLDNPNFPAGLGTPFIQLAADTKINNATSTKQPLSSASGLVVLAGDDHTHNYVHNKLDLATGPDTTAPTVTLTSPADGATVHGTVGLAATASDNVAVARVDFRVNGSLVGSATAAPYGVSWDSTTVTDGSATVSAQAFDTAGNPSTVDSHGVTVDNTAPDTVIDSAPSGTVTTTSASISFHSTEAGSAFACSLDGAPATACTSPAAYSELASGPHTFSVAATDPAGNTDPTPATASWTVDVPDTTPPTVSLTSPADGASVGGLVAITATASDNVAVDHVDLVVDGVTIATVTSPPYAATWDSTGRADGSTAQISAQAFDTSNNPSTIDSHTVTVDNSPPDTTITSAPSGTVTSSSATFTFTSSEAGSSFACSLDGGPPTACASPRDYAGLANGDHTFSVAATDPAGNTDPTPATASWTVDAPAGIVRQTATTVVNTTATSTVAIPVPSGTAAGDVLVVCLALNGSKVDSAGVPAGWSLIAAVTSVSNPRVFGYYRVAGASEPASYSWTLSSSVANSGGMARYSGVSGSGPLDAPVSAGFGAATTSPTLTGVTTASPNAMLVGCMGANSSNVGITGPAGMSTLWDLGGKREQADDAIQAAAGPSGAKTWTFAAAREWAGWLVALRPS